VSYLPDTSRNSLLLLSYASSLLFLFLQDLSAIKQTRGALCRAATKIRLTPASEVPQNAAQIRALQQHYKAPNIARLSKLNFHTH